jgi:hypothetical protein
MWIAASPSSIPILEHHLTIANRGVFSKAFFFCLVLFWQGVIGSQTALIRFFFVVSKSYHRFEPDFSDIIRA